MKFWTAIFSALFISLTGHAKEGFELSPPSRTMAVAWNATFALTSSNPKSLFVTSSVLVFKKVVGSSVYLGFLSSGHSMKRMLEESPIQRILISRNVRMVDQLDQQISLTDTMPGKILSKPVIDMESELSFFVVRLNSNQAANYNPVSFSPSCENSQDLNTHIFGFPGVFHRDRAFQREKIPASNLLTKRSSSGVLTGEFQFGPDQTIQCTPLVGTTADSLFGDSGAAVVDNQGYLTGVLVTSNSWDENDYAYQGFEGQQKFRAQSYVTGCRVTERFAQDYWSQFLASIGAKAGPP